MINKKLACLLAAPLLSGIIQMSADAALSSSASQTVQATLGTYLDIQAITDGTVLSTTIAPETGNLAASLISKFQARLNSPTQALYLQATAESATNPIEIAFFQQGGNQYLILANIGNKPTTAAIADCKVATPNPTVNVNAIAYPVTSVALTNSGTSTYDNAKNQYDVDIVAGETIATTTIGTAAIPLTYSYLDTAGTYQAILTLTSTSL